MWILAEVDKSESYDNGVTVEMVKENIEDCNGGYESENHNIRVLSIKEIPADDPMLVQDR